MLKILLVLLIQKKMELYLLKISSLRFKIFLTVMVFYQKYANPHLDRDELKGKTMTVNLRGRHVSITPEDYVMQNAEYESDLKVSQLFTVIILRNFHGYIDFYFIF